MRILFTSTRETAFVRQDLTLLRKHFDIDHLNGRGLRTALALWGRMRHASASFTWFASVYAFVAVVAARLRRRRAVVAIGGVDVAKIPELGYGIWLSWWKSILVGYAIRNAHRVLVVDPSQEKEARRLAQYDGANIMYVPTGYDPDVWFMTGEKEDMVLTVAGCHSLRQLRIKGIDMLFAAAAHMPDTRFEVVGVWTELLPAVRALAPANVALFPFIPQAELVAFYRRAKVYCQPSRSEGLPNSLCEAMLCECIPVGSRVGGIPTAIGDHGLLVPYGDPDALAGALRSALAFPAGTGVGARRHVATHFTLGRRESALVSILGSAEG